MNKDRLVEQYNRNREFCDQITHTRQIPSQHNQTKKPLTIRIVRYFIRMLSSAMKGNEKLLYNIKKLENKKNEK